MDGVTTPIKGGTDTVNGSTSISESHTSTETMPQGDNVFLRGDSSSNSSRSELNSTPSSSSSNTSGSSVFSIQSNESSSSIETPLTSTPAKDDRPKEPNAKRGAANSSGKNSRQPFMKTLQGEKTQANADISKRPSTPQTKGAYHEFGTDELVYPGVYKFNFKPPGHNSPTPCNVSSGSLNTKAGLHSRWPKASDSASNNSDPFSELENPRSPKKARKGNSVTPTSPLPKDTHSELDSGPPARSTAWPLSRDSSPNRSATPSQDASLEITSSLNTSPQVDVVSFPSDNIVTPLPGSGKAKAKRSKVPIPDEELRRSGRLKQKNKGTPTATATTETSGLDVEGSGTQKVDEDGATTDENQPPTSDRIPSPVVQETNSDNETTEAGEKPDVDTTEISGSIKFEQYEEMKSPTDIKIAILNVILQEDEKHTLDNKTGFVYMYKFNSSKGHIKIGKSNQKHGERVEQQARSCKLPFERISDQYDKKFLHFGVVEKLVHLELSNQRKKYECGTCKTKSSGPKNGAKATHGEWFEVEEEHALKVIERWRGWFVRHQPYGKDGALRGIWIWKHRKLSEASTDDFGQWVILTWTDWPAYAWYRIDDYLDKELPKMLRSSLFINATLIFVTRLWCVSGVFMSSVFTVVILAMFFKYS